MIKNILRKLTLGVSLAALAAVALPAAVNAQAYYAQPTLNGNSVNFAPGSALVAGPVIPPTTFSGTITNTTIGSNTNSVLSVVPPGTSVTPTLLVGSVITGSGVTTGTTISANLGSNNYFVIGPSNTVAAVATAEAMTATPSFTSNIRDTLSGTAPTYASGGCTTTAAFVAGSTPYVWTLNQGASGCSTNSTITLTFPAATTTWMCTATDITTPARTIKSTGAASTTAVVLTDYSAAGVAETMLANDQYTGTCAPH